MIYCQCVKQQVSSEFLALPLRRHMAASIVTSCVHHADTAIKHLAEIRLRNAGFSMQAFQAAEVEKMFNVDADGSGKREQPIDLDN